LHENVYGYKTQGRRNTFYSRGANFTGLTEQEINRMAAGVENVFPPFRGILSYKYSRRDIGALST
jgi:hypothetical protein